MAIVRMNELTFVGMKEDRDDLVKYLTKAGTLDISDMTKEVSESETSFATPVLNGEQISALDRKMSDISGMIAFCKKHDTSKKKLFAPRRDISESKYLEITDKEDNLYRLMNRRAELESAYNEGKSELNRLTNLITSLTPWMKTDLPLESQETGSTILLKGTIPVNRTIEEVYSFFSDNVPEGIVNEAYRDKQNIYIYIIYHKSNETAVREFVESFGFTGIVFNGIKCNASYNLAEAIGKIDEIKQRQQAISDELKTYGQYREDYELLYDYYSIEKNKQISISKMKETGSVFVLKGWLPETKIEKLSKTLEDKYTCVTYIRKPDPKEDYPILLRNNKFVKAFELITEMYSLPKAYEVDPNPTTAIFFFIGFGVMLGDAGYGLLMVLITGLVLKLCKPEGGTYKFMNFLFWCGISSVIFGACFGSWFALSDMFESMLGFRIPAFIEPLGDPITFIILSFAFGVIQLFVGMGIKAYMMIKDGDILGAIADIFSWYLIIVGLVVMLVGGSLGKYGMTVGVVMALVGAATVILFKGRDKKNPIVRLGSGLLGLYGITSYFGDVMSYSRILALSLASGVIGSVINTLGSMGGLNNVTGIILFAVVFLVGHIFNLAISGLGAYVHTSRLQYIEYFGKFYDGGGKPYSPLGYTTKYNKINSEEEL